MNTTPGEEVVLKQDVLGRVKTPQARREQLLDEFERSGLPGLKFAELAGIKYPTFATRGRCGGRVEISDGQQIELAAARGRALQRPGGRLPC